MLRVRREYIRESDSITVGILVYSLEDKMAMRIVQALTGATNFNLDEAESFLTYSIYYCFQDFLHLLTYLKALYYPNLIFYYY